jgi:hypothetical protein
MDQRTGELYDQEQIEKLFGRGGQTERERQAFEAFKKELVEIPADKVRELREKTLEERLLWLEQYRQKKEALEGVICDSTAPLIDRANACIAASESGVPHRMPPGGWTGIMRELVEALDAKSGSNAAETPATTVDQGAKTGGPT